MTSKVADRYNGNRKEDAEYVYRCLVEVFPQFDKRSLSYLKAVAWEHSKDSDRAVEVVLQDGFLARISDLSEAPGTPPLVDSSPSSLPNGEAGHEEPVSTLRRRRVPSEETASSSRSVVKEDAIRTDVTSARADSAAREEGVAALSFDATVETNQLEGNGESGHEENTVDSAINEVIPNAVVTEENGASRDNNEVITNAVVTEENDASRENNEVIPNAIVTEENDASRDNNEVIPNAVVTEENDASRDNNEVIPNAVVTEENDASRDNNEVIPNAVILEESNDHIADNEVIPNAVIHEEENTGNRDKNDQTSSLDVGVPCLIQENDGLNLSFTSFPNDWMDFDGPELDGFAMVSTENNRVVDSSLDHAEISSSSGYEEVLYDRMEALEEKKRMLSQAMELETKMTKDLELEKIAVEQAKEELLRLDVDILAKKQEFEQMIAHANEGYDMVAGEAYGERAILATEARELDARIISLSDEHDKALALFDERCKALEQQLAVESELRKALEQEKREKEESNLRDHAEREKEIEKVAERQKKIQQCIENNTKQRELILDRGRIIDSWQGELSLILKQKFSLSGSMSSSQSTCILASSVSCNVISELGETLESPKQSCSPARSVDSESSPKSKQSDERIVLVPNNGKELLLEDGWDLLVDA